MGSVCSKGVNTDASLHPPVIVTTSVTPSEPVKPSTTPTATMNSSSVTAPSAVSPSTVDDHNSLPARTSSQPNDAGVRQPEKQHAFDRRGYNEISPPVTNSETGEGEEDEVLPWESHNDSQIQEQNLAADDPISTSPQEAHNPSDVQPTSAVSQISDHGRNSHAREDEAVGNTHSSEADSSVNKTETRGEEKKDWSASNVDNETGDDSGLDEDVNADDDGGSFEGETVRSEDSGRKTAVSNIQNRSGVTLIRVGNRDSRRNKVVVESEGSLSVSAYPEAQQNGPADARDAASDSESQFHTMAGIGDLKITQPAPLFEANSVVGGEFKTIKLSDYRGKYVVLFFYPLDFTFVCPTEIIAFSDRAEEFKAIGCEVMACSTDSVYSHLAWVNTPRKQGGLGPMKIPLIADKTAEISKKYGCLKEDEGVAFRGLYIIDDKGNLRQITINDLPVGRSVDETLRLVQAFQFTDKHGEVCPAGWRPGKETMKPDPKGSQTYFTKAN